MIMLANLRWSIFVIFLLGETNAVMTYHSEARLNYILTFFSRGTDNLSSFLLSNDDMKQWKVIKIDHHKKTYNGNN